MRRHIAYTEWQAARGTAAESDALATFAETERAVEAYQIKIRLLRQIKAGLGRATNSRNQIRETDPMVHTPDGDPHANPLRSRGGTS